MFGKGRDDRYDEYNEKMSAQYDDDYISPSVEYHSEHYNSCEQLSSAPRTERHSFDRYSGLKERFEPLLMTDERLLWSGGKYDPAKKEKGPAFKWGVALLVVSIILICTIVLSVIGLLLITFSVSLMQSPTGIYGLTDKRVILIEKRGTTSLGLESIIHVRAVCQDGISGYIRLQVPHMLYIGNSRRNYWRSTRRINVNF